MAQLTTRAVSLGEERTSDRTYIQMKTTGPCALYVLFPPNLTSHALHESSVDRTRMLASTSRSARIAKAGGWEAAHVYVRFAHAKPKAGAH
eukprot:6187138-Pleurochrysis_carterae.AAC.2